MPSEKAGWAKGTPVYKGPLRLHALWSLNAFSAGNPCLETLALENSIGGILGLWRGQKGDCVIWGTSVYKGSLRLMHYLWSIKRGHPLDNKVTIPEDRWWRPRQEQPAPALCHCPPPPRGCPPPTCSAPGAHTGQANTTYASLVYPSLVSDRSNG